MLVERLVRGTHWDSQDLKTLLPVAVRQRTIILRLLPLVCALSLWLYSLSQVDLGAMSDLGLVSVFTPLTFLAFVVLIAGFCLSIFQREGPEWILLAYAISLIVTIHATPVLLYGTLRYSWAWKHVGIVDYIQRNGSVNPSITYLNVYHNWPGFFSLAALITEISGVKTAINFAGWAPVFFNLLDLGALLFIFKSFTTDRRLIWLAILFFFLGNWIGQDYFSPQAFTYFLHLVVLGICLTWLRAAQLPITEQPRRWPWLDRLAAVSNSFDTPEPGNKASATVSRPFQRAGLLGIVFLLLVVEAFSHQLTPLMTIAALTALVVFRLCNARYLPILMTVLTVGWVIFMTVGFLKGNINWVIHSIGSFSSIFGTGVVDLSTASPGQILIAVIDRGLSALLCLLAILGCIRLLRQGRRRYLAAILLALVPFPMRLASSYGGEMLLRVYFFALPFVAFWAAVLFYPSLTSGVSWRTALATIVLSCILLVGFAFGYYGKERANYFTPNEVDAAEYVHRVAPEGSLLLDGSWDWPLQYQNYELYYYQSMASLDKGARKKLLQDPVHYIAGMMKAYPMAYLIITSSQKAHIDMTGLMPAGSLDDIEQTLSASPQFKIIYSRPDAVIFTLANAGGGAK